MHFWKKAIPIGTQAAGKADVITAFNKGTRLDSSTLSSQGQIQEDCWNAQPFELLILIILVSYFGLQLSYVLG